MCLKWLSAFIIRENSGFYPKFRAQVLMPANTGIRGKPIPFGENVTGGRSENIEEQNKRCLLWTK